METLEVVGAGIDTLETVWTGAAYEMGAAGAA
jgi:hypothetical protein